MSGKQDRKRRRDMRRYFHAAGLTPEALQERAQRAAETAAAQFASRIRPRPRWCPARAWGWLVALVIVPGVGRNG